MAKTQVRERLTNLRGQKKWQELYQGLNERQREAVDAIEGPVMVLAGPGTGKTQVLTMRVANILRQTDMAPSNILCLTFTESAAAEMRTRLVGIMGAEAFRVRISTFHSFCNDVIQEWPEKFLLGGTEALAEVEQIELVRSLIDELPAASALKPFGRPYMYVPDILRAVKSLKQEGINFRTARAAHKQTMDFLARSATARAAFMTLPPRERSEAAVWAWREQLMAATESKALMGIIDGSFARFGEKLKAADSKREAKKIVTSLKNNLRRLFSKWERQAARQAELLDVYEAYQVKLEKIGRYDFEDMIMKVSEALGEDEQLLAHYQEQFQYVLVDEFQDTNGAQLKAVRRLGSFYDNPNIFVVGDDKQSIFRFQGASLENLLNFYEEYQVAVKVISLRDNYRSSQLILDAASKLIASNTETIQRYLPTVQTDLVARSKVSRPARLQKYEYDTEDEENFFVARKIKELLAAGTAPGEIAVLYRFNRDADTLTNLLLRLKVPVRLEAGEKVLEDRQVRQFLQLLRFAARPRQAEILAEILLFDFMGLDELEVLKVVSFAGQKHRDLLSVLADEMQLTEAGVKKTQPLIEVARKLARWHKLRLNKTLTQFFDIVLQESGLLAHMLNEKNNSLPVLNRLTALHQELTRLNRTDSRLTLASFVARLELLKESGLALTSPPWQTKSEAVRLMTAHKAKGLEFAHVFMIRLRDKHWGNLPERSRLEVPAGLLAHDAVQGQENNEDERRLFYVALTRAKQQLYLSYARSDSMGREQSQSQFLLELPPETVEEVDTKPTEELALKRLTTARLTPTREAPSDVRQWLAEQLAHYTMSVTHLNNYLRCPRMFYYRNLIRVPAAKTKHMAFGTAAHNALRDITWRFQKQGKLPTGKYLQGRFEFHLDRETLTPDEKNDSLILGREAMAAYWQRWQKDFKAPALVEYDFRAHGVYIDDLKLTGKVDKIEILDIREKRAKVVDYKTGNPDGATGKSNEGGDYRRQLVFYKLLADRSARFEYGVTHGEVDFIQPSKRTGKFVKKSIELTAREVMELQEQIRQVWAEIKELKFLEAEGCGACEYCDRL